jgi:F0F1-type ATP synthase assembly protein I
MQDPHNLKPNSQSKLNNSSSAYIKYSSIGLKLIATILIFLFLGRYIDSETNNQKHIFTITFTLLALIISMYILFKDISKI